MSYDYYIRYLYEYLKNGEIAENVSSLVTQTDTIISNLSDIIGKLGDIAFIALFGVALYFLLKMLSKGWFRL